MSLAANMQLTDQDVRSTSSVKGAAAFGQVASTSDGRKFAYGKAGASNLAAGKLHQGAVSTANHVNRTGTTQAAGDQSATFAVGATAVTADQYAGGYLVVNAGTGAGQSLLIRGNTAASSSGSPTVYLSDTFMSATSSSDSKFSLMPHAYSACIISDHTAATSVIPVGVPSVAVTAAYFAWFQVAGPASVLANGTPGVGVGVIPGATTDGSVDVEATTSVQPRVGYGLITAVSTEYRSVFLTVPHS